MRNAVTRRPHKERSQIQSRQKWGLLEKHKDYSLRAKDYNQKKAKLNILSQKSKERHPDEFAFGMLSAGSSAQGKHGRRGDENRLSHDAVQLLKTQDAGYLRTTAARTRKEIEKVREEVGMDRAGKKGFVASTNKVQFDEHGEPVKKRRKVSLAQDKMDMDLEEVVVNGATTITNGDEDETTSAAPKFKSRKQIERETSRLAQLKADRKRRKRLEELRKAKLEVLKKRQKEILAAADQLELQRARMANVVGGVNKNGVTFKVRERKR